MSTPARHVYMVTSRFVERVRSGVKRCTIRPRRKRMPKEGDVADLRAWSGLPYRSKQLRLRTSSITRIRDFYLSTDGSFVVGSIVLDRRERQKLARRDGFDNAAGLVAWFKETHGALPFHGFLTEWSA